MAPLLLLCVFDHVPKFVSLAPLGVSQVEFLVVPDVRSVQFVTTNDPPTCLYAMFVSEIGKISSCALEIVAIDKIKATIIAIRHLRISSLWNDISGTSHA